MANSMLVELGLAEQRHQAVREVLDSGATVVDVARHYGWRARRCMTGCAAMHGRGWLA
ncbi:MAG: transposase [Actinomycetota bacterium]|nr:transposase [Actinomycetota bacterium]